MALYGAPDLLALCAHANANTLLGLIIKIPIVYHSTADLLGSKSPRVAGC